MNSVRSLLLSGRSEVRLLSACHVGASAISLAPTFLKSERTHSAVSRFQTGLTSLGAGLVPPCGRLFFLYDRNIGLTALARRASAVSPGAVFLCPCPKRRHPSSPSHQHSCDRLLILTRPLFKAGSRISLYRISVRGQYAVPASGRGCWITEDPAPDRKP